VDFSLSDAEFQSLRDALPPDAAAGLRHPESNYALRAVTS